MAYFHVYMIMSNGKLEKVSANTPKRKSFTKEERIKIYRKTKGRCYLCGEFVDFNSYEIEHKVPLSKGLSKGKTVPRIFPVFSIPMTAPMPASCSA